MPSAAQIKARKAFVKKYAKKGKRKALLKKQTQTAKRELSKADNKGYYREIIRLTQKRRARARSKYPEVFENLKNQRKKWDIEDQTKLAKRYAAKGKAIMRKKGKYK